MIFAERLRSFLRRSFIGIASAIVFGLAVTTPSASTDIDGWHGHHQRDRSWIASWAASPQASFPTGLTMQATRRWPGQLMLCCARELN